VGLLAYVYEQKYKVPLVKAVGGDVSGGYKKCEWFVPILFLFLLYAACSDSVSAICAAFGAMYDRNRSYDATSNLALCVPIHFHFHFFFGAEQQC
jgi:hypothetical protein